METELQRCCDMSDEELLRTNREHPLFSLIPCWMALLARIEMKPESDPAEKDKT